MSNQSISNTNLKTKNQNIRKIDDMRLAASLIVELHASLIDIEPVQNSSQDNNQNKDYLTVNENVPVFYYYTKKESIYYPWIDTKSFENFYTYFIQHVFLK